MESEPDSPYQGAAVETCYRHPREQTRVHCTRCGRPICPDCMIPAPVGHQCPECVGEARKAFRQGPVRQARTIAGMSVTRWILAVLVAVFAVEIIRSNGQIMSLGVTSGGGKVNTTLFDMGALFTPSVAVSGQWWRLLSAIFLHASLLHIAFNGYALWLFGQFIEQWFSRAKFLLIFFVAGFMGSVASYVFGAPLELGVGASGAIVGLFGAFIAYNFRRRHLAVARGMLRWAMIIIALNVFITFGFSAIDWRAHVGGLIAGAATGTLLEGVGPRPLQRVIAVVGIVALVGLGMVLTVAHGPSVRAFCTAHPGACAPA